MQVSFATARRTLQDRRTFTLFCVISGAILAVLSGQTWLSLVLYGASLLVVIAVSLVLRDLAWHPERRHWLVPLSIAALLVIFILSRFGRLQILLFGSPISRFGQWVGLSYLIFRLIHVLIDSEKLGKLAADSADGPHPDNSPYRNQYVGTGDLAAYALFPPALVAGPIHRANQFLPQLDQPHYPTSGPKLVDCLWRIGLGAAKKLVIANALSLFALTSEIAVNAAIPRWMLWLSLVAYTLMIYFDFAGYSDIAIGAAGLVGIVLPENFANPYAQGSVTRFWQTWHMSLSFWLRDYIFFPLSRFLLARLGRRWATPIMAAAHLVTMGLAGLWHGFSTGFLAWGLWHGAGLFVNAQWTSFTRQRGFRMPAVVGVALTFTFVMFGWVFFALGDVRTGVAFISRLFGQ